MVRVAAETLMVLPRRYGGMILMTWDIMNLYVGV